VASGIAWNRKLVIWSKSLADFSKATLDLLCAKGLITLLDEEFFQFVEIELRMSGSS
jgi:hypothetical protein